MKKIMQQSEEIRHPLPPFSFETATQKVYMAEDGWNRRDAAKVALAYSLATQWRNRAEFVHNREDARQFLERKWAKELEYRLIKELWTFTEHRIAVHYAYEWHDDSGNWFRSYGNENWEFDTNGLMTMNASFTGRWDDALMTIQGYQRLVCSFKNNDDITKQASLMLACE